MAVVFLTGVIALAAVSVNIKFTPAIKSDRKTIKNNNANDFLLMQSAFMSFTQIY
jgi:hypothetical protein